MKTKMQLAAEFLVKFMQMDQKELGALVDLEAGRDLAQFLAMYSAIVVKRFNDDPKGAAAACMVVGYMVRAYEDRQTLYLPPEE